MSAVPPYSVVWADGSTGLWPAIVLPTRAAVKAAGEQGKSLRAAAAAAPGGTIVQYLGYDPGVYAALAGSELLGFGGGSHAKLLAAAAGNPNPAFTAVLPQAVRLATYLNSLGEGLPVGGNAWGGVREKALAGLALVPDAKLGPPVELPGPEEVAAAVAARAAAAKKSSKKKKGGDADSADSDIDEKEPEPDEEEDALSVEMVTGPRSSRGRPAPKAAKAAKPAKDAAPAKAAAAKPVAEKPAVLKAAPAATAAAFSASAARSLALAATRLDSARSCSLSRRASVAAAAAAAAALSPSPL